MDNRRDNVKFALSNDSTDYPPNGKERPVATQPTDVNMEPDHETSEG